ncbi:3-alpha,7-alpha,12-alpha-trihydroxy-5-beta-cholest-24-enoyl-CoA hydratase [Altererythrobacter sp. FM1]|uniref:MaoC/PaaZ C-terminal domain-containing protein n=1 Tax=Tsuneonella flava TaxID=2055955 RepID=UPI000C80F58D|nr:MaoC/PaaZ C-terminal domain-containing protein [Tsuneonella flava]ROT97378.1 3-alpha,7-alpha,12-alpha-trihydroxy-5-beta-cholest-24-enoyl-CoA hydratase [Altererythrobacter sp. FM1]
MNAQEVVNYCFETIEQSYSARDAILYALATGYATQPLDPLHLRYLYENSLTTAPTFANVLGYPGLWMNDPRVEIDWVKMLHAEHRMTLHRSLPPAASTVSTNRVTGLRDLGPRGAMVHYQTDITLADEGEPLATLITSVIARGDGGCGDWGDAPPSLERVPERNPDATIELATSKMQPLLYRLSGDLHPIHIDPAVSSAAGLRRPLLHGLATKGMAGYALLRQFCDLDAKRLMSMAVRFTRPVMPGDVLRFEFWGEAPGRIQFRAVAVNEGDAPVLDRCEAVVT